MRQTKIKIDFESHINISLEHMHLRTLVLKRQLEGSVTFHVDLHNVVVKFITDFNILEHRKYEQRLLGIHFGNFVVRTKFPFPKTV